MQGAILNRYLIREAAGAWLAVTVVLLAIMLSTRFARFLAMAAAGKLPEELLFYIAALSSLQYLMILIPVSLLLAIMLSLGRLYKDQEMTAMTACGVGSGRFYRPFLWLAGALAVFTGLLSFQLGPWAGRQSDHLVEDASWLVQFSPFEPGRFREVGGGRAVFYTDSVSTTGEDLGFVFARLREREGEGGGDSIVTARRGRQSMEAGGERKLILQEGWRYLGDAGRADFDIAQFGELSTRVVPPEFLHKSDARKVRATAELLGSADPADVAELHFRLAAPISVFLLALMAVPLSYIGPRQGRYGKLVIGIVVYLVYSNLLSLGQAWIAKSKLPPEIGLWWVHALAAGVALWLIARREGWAR